MKLLVALLVVAFVMLGAASLGYFMLSQQTNPDFSDTSKHDITIDSTVVHIEVVSSEASREQGLSGRDSLPTDSGMLFIFESDGKWGIWMKDMKFSIDILWADAQGRVITVTPDISPDTYPQVFYPSAPARYVIELPAGWTAAHTIGPGSKIVL